MAKEPMEHKAKRLAGLAVQYSAWAVCVVIDGVLRLFGKRFF